MTDTLERESPTDAPPKPPLGPGQVRCGICGLPVLKGNLPRHRKDMHGMASGGRKPESSAAPSASPLPSFKSQVEMIYRLGGQVTAQRLPVTGGAIVVQAGPCAEAWDRLFDRYPAVKEWMEKAGFAGDVVAVFVAHYPILEAARGELQARQEAAVNYNAQAGADQSIN